MKFNKKSLAKILLVIIVISALAMLTGCDVTPNEGVNESLGVLSGGLLGALIVFMYSVLLAIGSVFVAIFSLIAGLFQLIGALIGMLF